MKTPNPKDSVAVDKLPLHLWPMTATATGCLALHDGALKYGRSNWRLSPVRASVYVDAAHRHIAAWFEGEVLDLDSGIPHLGHALACLAILVDADAAGTLVDDRQVAGGHRATMDALTPLVKALRERHEGEDVRHYTINDTPHPFIVTDDEGACKDFWKNYSPVIGVPHDPEPQTAAEAGHGAFYDDGLLNHGPVDEDFLQAMKRIGLYTPVIGVDPAVDPTPVMMEPQTAPEIFGTDIYPDDPYEQDITDLMADGSESELEMLRRLPDTMSISRANMTIPYNNEDTRPNAIPTYYAELTSQHGAVTPDEIIGHDGVVRPRSAPEGTPIIPPLCWGDTGE